MFKLNYLVIPLITVLVAITGGWLTSAGIDGWYESLGKPEFFPPDWVFGPVWTTLYAMITISVLIIWNKAQLSWRYKTIIALFIVNAILNVLWTWLFFYQHALLWALGEMLILNLTTVILVVLIWPISRVASLLLLPYLVWVSYVSYLSYLLWIVNL